MDPTVVGLVVFTIIVLVVIWFFRHRIKIAIKGPAGMSLEVEAENVPPKQVPNGTGIKQTGDRSVAAGGDITHSKVITGDRSVVGDVVQIFEAADADVVDRITERVLPSRRRQLPADLVDFAGREREIAELEAPLSGDGAATAIFNVPLPSTTVNVIGTRLMSTTYPINWTKSAIGPPLSPL